MQYGRKGKSLEKSLDRIVGTSDRLFAEKARELKIKAVTRSKGQQLNKCLLALGVYLRKLIRFCLLGSPQVLFEVGAEQQIEANQD